MDANTMIVRLVETVLWFALACLIAFRYRPLWLRLQHLKIEVPGWLKMSAVFFKAKRCTRTSVHAADPFDLIVITHSDHDHVRGAWNMLIAPHHGSR